MILSNPSPADDSPAIRSRVAHPRCAGTFTEAEAQARGCTLARADHGAVGSPEHIELFLVVDSGGTIRDARFRSGAGGVLLAAYDAMTELCIGRTLTTLAITPRQADALLRQGGSEPVLALSDDADTPYYVCTKAAERAKIPAKTVDPAAPAAPAPAPWTGIGLFEKVRRIEGILDQHIRPALASDGGGLDLVDLKGDELMVQYHGACGSCSSSIGGTLQFIQDSLNNHLGTTLQVKVAGVESPEFGMT
jgi:NifU-like protein